MWLTAETKRIIAEKFSEFCKISTIHGVYYFHKKDSKIVYVIWITIILAGLVLCVLLCHMIWIKFVLDPTFTVVESTHYSTSDIPFPAVTVCDSELSYAPNTKFISQILIRRGFTIKEINAFFEGFSKMSEVDYTPEKSVLKMHSVLEDLGYSLKQLMFILRKPCDVLLMQCIWRSRVHNCSELFRAEYTYTGVCCRFDMDYFKAHASNDTTFISGRDLTESLEIKVDVSKIGVRDTITEGMGFLYITDHKNKISIIDSYVILSGGVYYDVNVDVWMIDSSDDVKALSLESRKCTLETDKDMGGSYFQHCIMVYIMKRVVNYCQCLPFNLTASELGLDETYVQCTWERQLCIYKTIKSAITDSKLSHDECYQKCDAIQYETRVDFVRLHRNDRVDQKAYSTVGIHFADTTCMKYRRELLYTWDQMLANLGGIFGLCLGGSIISVMEFLWFIVDVCRAVYESKKKKSTKKQLAKNNTVFTINPKNVQCKRYSKKSNKVGSIKYIN